MLNMNTEDISMDQLLMILSACGLQNSVPPHANQLGSHTEAITGS